MIEIVQILHKNGVHYGIRRTNSYCFFWNTHDYKDLTGTCYWELNLSTFHWCASTDYKKVENIFEEEKVRLSPDQGMRITPITQTKVEKAIK